MKAILVALLAGMVLFAIVTLVLRLSPTKRRARAMLVAFLAVLPFLVLVHLVTPPDLGFLPARLVTPIAPVDLAFAVFLYGVGFFGGILQLYNLADRGFSLRILVDILESRHGTMDVDGIMAGYSAGRGIVWMYDKRVQGMVSTGLVCIEGDRLILTDKGRRAADVFRRLRDLARTPSPSGTRR